MPAKTEIIDLTTVKYSVGIYSRLSVEHDDRKSESIENQIEIIRQYLTNENNNPEKKQEFDIYDIYIDRGISGAFFERAGFDRLMEDVRNHKVNCIMVKDLSRLGRNYLETGNYIEKLFPLLGVRFIAVTDGFDSMSENASERKLVMNIKNLVNDMYTKDISKRVMTARKMTAEKGLYIGSTSPYGYDAADINGMRRLVIHSENAGIVRYLFESYAAGISCGEMVTCLYKKKVHRISDYNKYGHTFWEKGEILHQWNLSSIRGILSNPVYTGKLVQCKTKSRLQEGQKGICYTRENEWITVENSHEAIVEQELYDKVNAVLTGMSGKAMAKSESKEYTVKDDENIFRHILYCSDCGDKMQASYYQSRVDGKRSYAYHCRRAYYLDERKCNKNYIREDQLENYVAEQIKQALKNQKLSSKKLTDLNRLECERMKTAYLEEQNMMIQEQQKLSMQAGTLYMKYREGKIGAQEYLAFRENRAEHDKFCEKRWEELNKRIRKSEIRAEEQNKFLRSLQKTEGCKKLNVQLIESLIEKIAVSSNGIIDISFRFHNRGESDV